MKRGNFEHGLKKSEKAVLEPREFRDGDIVTFEQFSKDNPAWSVASLRWMRFNEATNGLADAGAFIQIGRRVLLDKQAFFGWVRNQQRARKA